VRDGRAERARAPVSLGCEITWEPTFTLAASVRSERGRDELRARPSHRKHEYPPIARDMPASSKRALLWPAIDGIASILIDLVLVVQAFLGVAFETGMRA
jgi:hypothetical protein